MSKLSKVLNKNPALKEQLGTLWRSILKIGGTALATGAAAGTIPGGQLVVILGTIIAGGGVLSGMDNAAGQADVTKAMQAETRMAPPGGTVG